MFRIVSGAFHPSLESALIEEIRSLKTPDPFAAVAVVAPSTQLADRLKRRLVLESGLSSLNCHILTFHRFALCVKDDLVASGEPLPAMQFVDDFYFEQLVRHVVKRSLPGLDLLTSLPPSPGTWKALWGTLRDLKDAAVVPATALKAISEGVFDDQDRGWLEALFTLQAAVLEGSRSLGVGSADDLLAVIGDGLPRSSFLRQFRQIFYYGFYDLLQVQLTFVEAVARHAPVALYVPLEPGQPYDFARRFFDQHLLPRAITHHSRNTECATPSGRVSLSVTNVIGAEEELSTVCREILALVEVHGYRFDDIGVVARSLEPYRDRLQSVFDRHLVPFTSTATQSLSREPLVKALLRLASLPMNDFERSALLDVVSSPFYRVGSGGMPAITPRPDQWRIAASLFGITRGEAEWQRLSDASAAAILREAESSSDEETGALPLAVDPEQVSLLASLVSAVLRDGKSLPARGSVSRLTDAFLDLTTRHFEIPGWTDLEEDPNEDKPEIVGFSIKQALAKLSALDPLETELSWEEWTELFRQALNETALPGEPGSHRGVRVLDAMEARGLPFRALFVIGMHEPLFPRFIREDPFLRDRHRQILASTLGFLIEEKLNGHDEERLLFEMLCGAVINRLYLSYQRSDEKGRILARSALVERAERDPRFVPVTEVAVPRRLTARVAAQPAIQELLPVQDLALTLLLHDHEADAVLEETGQDRVLCARGLAVQMIKERETKQLGPFDGLLEPQDAIPSAFDERGLSPTALERYAACPFRYFAERVLRLEPVRVVQDGGLVPLSVGMLIHDTLRRTYERLKERGWPDVEGETVGVPAIISRATAEVFASHAATHGTGHELLWTMTQEHIVSLVTAAVQADEAEYRASGFRPYAFEAAAEGIVSLGAAELKVKGKLDRIDVRADPPELRIIDYKFKQGSEMGPQDRNLTLSAVRGFKLQPPLYGAMGLPSLPPPSSVQFLFLAPRWEPPIDRSTFEISSMQGRVGTAIRQTISDLVHGIERREFFILPDGYCDHCDFSSLCRRHDQTAWRRARHSAQAKALRRLRTQKVQDE